MNTKGPSSEQLSVAPAVWEPSYLKGKSNESYVGRRVWAELTEEIGMVSL